MNGKTLEEIKGLVGSELENGSLRGLLVEFQDGKKWKIRTMPLSLDDTHPLCMAIKASESGRKSSAVLDTVLEAVRLNYPDVDPKDVNPDIEDYFAVMAQVTGTNAAKKFKGDLTDLKS